MSTGNREIACEGTEKLTRAQWVKAAGVLLCVSVLGMLPSLITGPTNGQSYFYNVHWFETFSEQLYAGELFPRWLAGLWHGAGAADFFFYGPLPFYVAAIFGAPLCLGCESDGGFVLGALLIHVGAGISFLCVAKRVAPFNSALAGASLYLMLPNHLGFIWYFRQTLGEFMAFLMLPLVVYFYLDLREGRPWAGLGLSLCFGALALTHLPSLVTVSCFVGVLLLVDLLIDASDRRASMMAFVRVGAAGMLGLGVSAFYWLPAISLLSEVSPEEFNRDLMIWDNWLFFDGVAEPVDIVDFGLILKAYLVLGTLTAAYSLSQNSPFHKKLKPLIVLPIATAWLFMTPLSWPIWHFVSLLQKIQFPFRFMLVFDFGLGLAFVHLCAVWSSELRMGMKGPVTVLMLLFLVHDYSWAKGFSRTNFPPEYQVWHDEGRVLKFGPLEYQPNSALQPSVAMMVERQAMQTYLALPEVVVSSGQVRESRLSESNSREYALNIDVEESAIVVLKRTYWRLWEAIDSNTLRVVRIEPDAQYGLVQLELPPGQHDIQFTLPTHRTERQGAFVSFVAGALLLLWSILIGLRRRATES